MSNNRSDKGGVLCLGYCFLALFAIALYAKHQAGYKLSPKVRCNDSLLKMAISTMLSVVVAFMILAQVNGLKYNIGQLVEQLQQHGINKDQLGTWVCLAKYSSNIDTAYNPLPEFFGMFKVEKSQCGGAGALCPLPCAKLTDNYIGDDIQCIKNIYAHNWKKYGNGFVSWYLYNELCHDRKFTDSLLEDCYTY